MNSFSATGRLTRDPEMQYVGERELTRFSIAVDRGRKDKEGNKLTDFFDCACWGSTAKFVANYIGKGRQVFVVGAIETNSVEKDGVKRTYINVSCERVEALADAKRADGDNDAPAPNAGRGDGVARNQAPAPQRQPVKTMPDDDDDDDVFASQ